MTQEFPLSGGHASHGVVRVGETVRKPWTEHSQGVLAYMSALRDRGIDCPEPLGQDGQGRMMTEFVDGALAMESTPMTDEHLSRVGAMVRAIHDASEGLNADALGLGPALIPTDAPDLVCHGDLTPWNLITGRRWVFIDWDGAAASTRVWDLAYSAQAFTLNDPAADPHLAAARLRAFADSYQASQELRSELTHVLPSRAWAMHDLLKTSHRTGRQPWASMYAHRHGTHWQQVATFVEQNADLWTHALTSGSST